MPGGGIRDSLGWLESAPTFLGVDSGENLNAKGTHVGMNVDEVLDRGSTPLTSRISEKTHPCGGSFRLLELP